MTDLEYDATDQKILDVLTEKSRLSYRQIAKKIGTSVVTVMNRVKKLEKAGIIRGYTTILDYEKLGYQFNVMIDTRVTKGRMLEVGEQFKNHPNIYGIYDITGAFDMSILCRFKNRKQLDDFVKKLQAIPFVERTDTKLILNVVKE